MQSCAKGVRCVDLGESFQTHIFLQNLASMQPRTSPVKFARWRTPWPAEVERLSVEACATLGRAVTEEVDDPQKALPVDFDLSEVTPADFGSEAWLKGSISNLTLIFKPNDQTS